MKKVIKSIIGVSVTLGLSGVAYATGETTNIDTTCYAISDDVKEIYVIKPNSTNVKEATIISTSAIHEGSKGKYNGEASAFNSKTKKLYLFNNPFLGTTDDENKFNLYSVDISDPTNPKQELIKKNFIDFEPTGADYYNEKLYVIKEDRNSTLFIYNTQTWKVESQLNIEKEISGFAINTKTGEAYVMDDRDKHPTQAAELFKLDLTSGALKSVSVLSNDDFDAESLSFGGEGKLYTENERKEEKRSIYEISTKDASVTLVAYLPGENNISKNDIESISCTYTEGDINVKPTTDDKLNPKMPNTLGAVNILNLSGKDSNGVAIERFTILSLPKSNQGILYMEDATTPVEVNQTLTLAEANGLKFDPNENFEGDVTFFYVSVDSNGLIGDKATVTIPLVSGNAQGAIPTTDNKVNQNMPNTLGAVNILNLSGKDTNGKKVERFIITSLPSTNQGVLYMADAKTPITLNQELTLKEADGLRFDPKLGYVGDVIFNYRAIDSKGIKGNEATVTIPVVSEGNQKKAPVTDDKTNPKMLNTLGAVNIVNLSGTDSEGNRVETFVILSLPLANTGTLYMADGKTPVTINQKLTLEEANGLKFDPKAGFEGDSLFTYQAIDAKNVRGNIATVTLPIVSTVTPNDKKPVTDNRLSGKLFNDMGATNITNLSGTDLEGKAVEKFIITSLPSANQGILYMADGKTPVTVNQELTLEEANGLKFDPKAGFVGDVTFNYSAIDSKGVKGSEATVTIPVVEREGQSPVAPQIDNKKNETISNDLGAVDIINLSGTDAKGDVVKRFVITSLPSADQGVLYMADGKTPVTLNQELTLEEANGLKFDPKAGFVGDVTFNYVGLDTNGVRGNEATVTIPVVASNGQEIVAKADNKKNEPIANNLGAVDIVDLSGTDANGTAIKRFVITSLPSADQGVLYMADGKTPVTLNQELTLEEANGLRFDPKEGFVGDATFNYVGLDADGVRGSEATVTLPIIGGNNKIVPTTDNKTNPELLNSMGATNITNLSGTDAEGNAVERFIITSLPSADQGVLYMADGKTPVTLNQELTLEEANGLKFDPKEGFVGDATFNYASIDSKGLRGKEATVTIPVVTEHAGVIKPVSDNRSNPPILNTMGAVNITDLSGTDANGTAIERFVITSLPSADQGVLYMEDGKTPVTLNQELTLEEANGLRFDPKEGFVGDATFNYVGLDSDGVRGSEATVTLPIIGGNNKIVPTTDNKTNPELLNSMGATNITNLSGTDAEGNAVERFIITSLPSADQGVLYMADGKTPVTLNQELTLEEANGLKFDPKEGFVGDATFNYASIDSKGLRGKEATVTIPVVTEHAGVIKPVSDNRSNPPILNTMGAVNITDLSGTDANGTAIERFVITSLPSADQGVLYMEDGKTPVTLNQELSLEEANGLRFDPKEGFVGDATFNYVGLDSDGVRGSEATVTLPIIGEAVTAECVCEDYNESIPVFSGLSTLFMLLFGSFLGMFFTRKEA